MTPTDILLERPGADGLDGLSRDELIRALQVRQPRGQGEPREVRALSADQYAQLQNALEARAAKGELIWLRNRALVCLIESLRSVRSDLRLPVDLTESWNP